MSDVISLPLPLPLPRYDGTPPKLFAMGRYPKNGKIDMIFSRRLTNAEFDFLREVINRAINLLPREDEK